MTSNNKKIMHKTIQEINLGLSSLNLVADAQSRQNLFKIFSPVYEYLDKQKTIVRTSPSPRLHYVEYIDQYENFLIRIVEEDKRSIFMEQLSNGNIQNPPCIFLELIVTDEIDEGYTVYKLALKSLI